MLLLRRLAYRLMAQLTFLGKVQTVNLNVVSYEDVSVSTHFTRNFRPLYFGLHRIFDLMAKRQLFGFQLAQMHFGANAQVKESESKNLGGQIRRR